MSATKFKGVYCPSITPLKEDGSIDFDYWESHLNFLISSGISGILVFGSIGEFYSLSLEEKKEAIQWAGGVIDGRVSYLVGTGDTRIENTFALNECAHASKADAAVLLSPYYFGPSAQLASRYFRAVAEKSPLDLILYNFPDRTGNDLDAKLVSTLAQENPRIIGIKDTVDSAAHARRIVTATPADFAVLSGFDEYYIPNRIAGGSGVLSGLTNVVPDIFADMHNAYKSDDFSTALDCARKISDLMAIYDIGDHFIPTIKAAVKARRGDDAAGLSVTTRDVSIPLEPDELSRIKQLVDSASK